MAWLFRQKNRKPMLSVLLPDELYYSKNHEWLLVDENLATLGLTPFALENLGEVLYLDLPEDGQNTFPEQIIGSIESVRKIHDIISLITGTVLEVNLDLLENPSLLNDDPFGEGWLFKVELDNERDLANLLRLKDYKEFAENPANP